MNIAFKAAQGKGKTATVCASAVELCNWFGYDAKDIVANFHINLPGVTVLNNDDMRAWFKTVINKGIKHKIICIDEIDRVFPARLWADKEQTLGLLGMWQDEKLFNYMLYTCHLGTSIDKIIRESTQISVMPMYDKEEDRIDLDIADGLDLINLGDNICPAADLWMPGRIVYKGQLIEKRLYDRWEIVR